MGEKTGLKCPNCGGALERIENGLLECIFCGSVLEKDFAEEKKSHSMASDLAQSLNEAQNLHMLGHFDDAAEMFEAITQKCPDEAFAYWGAFLSEYGVQYT